MPDLWSISGRQFSDLLILLFSFAFPPSEGVRGGMCFSPARVLSALCDLRISTRWVRNIKLLRGSDAMNHVGRHQRSFRSALGFPSRSAACAPLATAGEFPRSCSSTSDALSSSRFPPGTQAKTTELGSGFHRHQNLELKCCSNERAMLQEENQAMAKYLAAHRLVGDTDLGEGEILKLANLRSGSNKNAIIETLAKSLILRNKSYKELMARCNELGMGESRALRKSEKTIDNLKKIKDISAVRLFKSPWHAHPCSAVLLTSHGSSKQISCSSYSSVWKRSSSSTTASVGPGDSLTIELWEEYFASPSQWWDNRSLKRNPRSPDFKHKVTGKALWIDGWYTPAWVKAKFKLVAQVRLESDATYTTQDTGPGKRQAEGNNRKLNTVPNSARALGQIVQGGGGSLHVLSATTLSEAIAVLKNQLQQGFIINSYMYVEVLKQCLKQKDLVAAKQVHDCILKSGMEQNTYVVNNLLRVYIGCGRLQEARCLFNALVKKDGFSWNTMIGGYAQHNRADDAMGLFHQMCHEDVQRDKFTYLIILKACANSSALNWGKEVHANIRQDGLESDVRVGTALLKMYAKCGCIKEARHIFNNLTNRDVISWNVMIDACAESGCGEEAYQLFLQMKQEGFKPDAITYTSILNASASASAGALDWVKEVHRHVLKAGLELDLRLATALVHMYARSGSIDDARVVFDRMKKRDVITWNVMIGGLAEHGYGQDAYELFLQMQREGCEPNAVTYVSILNASASAGALDWVKEVHRHVIKAGLELDLRVGNALIHMYAKSGSIDDARVVFHRMKERDAITWTVMIGGLAAHGYGQDAYELFLQMQREGFQPDATTYLNILNASASAGALYWVKEVHRHVVKAGLELDLRVGNALIHMYAKSGSIDDARVVFHRMKERDAITWTVLIGGLGQHGFGLEALRLFREMNSDGVKPNEYTFVAVLSACSHSGLVDEGSSLYSAMTQDYGIEPDVLHCNCMVDLLGRAGRLEEAKLFISNMAVQPDEATWGALLGACRIHGNVELGEFAAKKLLELDAQVAATYVLLSNIYAEAGRWDMVSSVRTMMREKGVRKMPGRSWIEVDNKIHHFFVADFSHIERTEIYDRRDRVFEKLKAEGYIPDTQIVLKNIDEEDKEHDICSHSEKLAIVYGLMHTPPEKPIRVFKNLRVCKDCHTATKFIAKVEGREIIVRDANRFHHFKDGVCSCGDYW